jgi:hypothetical protein
MNLVGALRRLSAVLAIIGPAWERRNGVGLKDYIESEGAEPAPESSAVHRENGLRLTRRPTVRRWPQFR